jgi:excisionase family DNA binding protein
MTTQVLHFVELPDRKRKRAEQLPKLSKGDRLEVRVRRRAGGEQTVPVPPELAAMIENLLGHLARGDRVAVLAEEQELTPNEAARILGISRPLVVHRMEVGELPFRYVGKHRRVKLKDVIALKTKMDAQQAALEALVEETEVLISGHGL